MDLMDLMMVGILYEGKWKENQVEIKIDQAFLPKITEEMQRIAKVHFDERKVKNPCLFDGPVMHLAVEHSTFQPDSLFLALGEMTYSLSQINREKYAEKFGWRNLPIRAGTNVALLTSDSKVIMHRRLGWVENSARIGVIGGFYSQGTPFENLQKEIYEELAVSKEEIENIMLIAVSYRFAESIGCGLDFTAETLLSSNQILEREKTIQEPEGKIFFLDWEPRAIREYLKQNYREILPSSFITLVAAGRYYWGPDWSDLRE